MFNAAKRKPIRASLQDPTSLRSLHFERLERRNLLAALITVNTEADSNLRDAVLSLREAIEINNRTLPVASLTTQEQTQVVGIPSATDSDSIGFNIPGAGVHTISPASALPALTDPVTIDGYTQPGASPNTQVVGNNAVLRIVIDGSLAGVVDGVIAVAPNNNIRGLAIAGFGLSGIFLGSTSIGNVVAGNFIGTDETGAADGRIAGNGDAGIRIEGDNNRVGGAEPADRNLLSGNFSELSDGFGVRIMASGNTVLGNYIGTDLSGTAPLSNGIGINVEGSNNVIGGTTAASRNVVSGNSVFGIGVGGGLTAR